MGIDFSHGDASWAYSGFNRFRTRLASEIGINLYEMEGFTQTEAGKSWEKITDNIEPLLNHSDCDGILSPEECKRVAPRLRELIKDWLDDDYDKVKALKLADGMEEAVNMGEDFEFI